MLLNDGETYSIILARIQCQGKEYESIGTESGQYRCAKSCWIASDLCRCETYGNSIIRHRCRRDKFHSLMMSVSKKIQIDKERGKKIGETEVAKNLLEVGVPIDVIQQATGLQDLKAI
ncbi:MAG: hypothetical protein LJD31_03485 [Wolbachia endosymbiont of Menacanthus eurysternus]|nr:hypothetical protein [Wolbachia endosymbiont of Menacanthus eurysternus]